MRKTLWSALALVMVLTLAGCGEQHRTDGSVTDSATYTPDAGYTLGNTDVVQLNGFRAIDIEWVSGQVNVELYDGEGIQLSETLADGSDVTLQMEWRVDEDDSELEIRSQPQLMSSTEEKILTVKLPRSMVLYGLDIDAVSAGVSVDLTDEDTLSLSELDAAQSVSMRPTPGRYPCPLPAEASAEASAPKSWRRTASAAALTWRWTSCRQSWKQKPAAGASSCSCAISARCPLPCRWNLRPPAASSAAT